MITLADFDPADEPATDSQIRGAELLIGQSLPVTCRWILARYGGACGHLEFSVPWTSDLFSVGQWLSVLPWHSNNMWSVLSCWPEHEMPLTAIPIGVDGGGNWLCLDYRETAIPRVAYYFAELQGPEGLFVLADDFDRWICALVPGLKDITAA